MRKTTFWILTILFLCWAPRVWADQAAVPTSGEIVDAGNTICPISGDPVNPKAAHVFEGKNYHFCCQGCVKKFKKDPKKYLASMKEVV